MSNATPESQPPAIQPLSIWNPTIGIWESPQIDLFGQRAPFSAIWWTSGMTRNGSVYPLPPSAHPTPATESSSSPTALFRTPLASDAARGGESLQRVKARRGTIALSHQIIDLALHGPNGHHRGEKTDSLWHLISDDLRGWGRYAPAIAQWERITGRTAPAAAKVSENAGPKPAPDFVEWLMGLDANWVTSPAIGLTDTQRLAALGNGVLPRQAVSALRILLDLVHEQPHQETLRRD